MVINSDDNSEHLLFSQENLINNIGINNNNNHDSNNINNSNSI